jgi:hypothetical protein
MNTETGFLCSWLLRWWFVLWCHALPRVACGSTGDITSMDRKTYTLPAVAAGDGVLTNVDTPALVLTESEAARAVRLSARTMQRMRLDGNGPCFVRLTGRRVGYAIDALQVWVRARSVDSTSEAGVRK